MSTVVTMLPFASRAPRRADQRTMRALPGLRPPAIQNLRSRFPGVLTSLHERLLQRTCGLESPHLGAIDFTGQLYDEEALSVFRPSLTLAVDRTGGRWIAETSKEQGSPGPVWHILPDPPVALYVSASLDEFVSLLEGSGSEAAATWLQELAAQARWVWEYRGALAFQSRQECAQDSRLRGWLLELPRDARVYDLRSPERGDGWPYGVAGRTGRLHRCGRDLLFAVSGFPTPARWAEHLASLASIHETPTPAVMATRARSSHGPGRTTPARASRKLLRRRYPTKSSRHPHLSTAL